VPRRPTFALLACLLAAPAWPQAAPSAPVTADLESVSDADETLAAAQKALGEARAEPEKLRALATVVNLQRRRGDYADGLNGASDGLVRARQLGDARLQIEFLYLLGRLHWNLTDYPEALENHLEELKLAEKLGDASLLARTHGGLGLTYLRYGRAQDAVQHIEAGLKFAREAGDERMRGSLLNSLGNHYLGERDHARAAALFTEALEIRRATGNTRAIAETQTNLGLVADAQGDHARALDQLGQALKTFEALKYRRYIANTHRRLARVWRNAGRADEALAHLGTALQIADTLNSPEVMVDIHQEYALTHEARGDFAAALAAQRAHAAAVERMRNERDRRRVDELRARYEAGQREMQIALLRREQQLKDVELDRRRGQTYLIASLLLLVGVVLGAVIYVQRATLRNERHLREAMEHARQRAEAAERLKSRLLQIASHDLKVPLSALNATAALIGRSAGEELSVRRLAEGIQTDTARMRGLVRDFLDASAIEDGDLQLHRSAVDLAALAGEAARGLQTLAALKEQRLVVHPVEGGLAPVSADPERLRQVFDNLIGNALKFSPLRGEVSVTLGHAPGWAFAEVRDSGPGLGPEDFARIFSPFQTLSAKPTGQGEDSTGLGLFIARELLNLQGGRLEVQSQPGQGSVFRVLLPVAAAAPAVG
jgi:signal transduction histidine kinase